MNSKETWLLASVAVLLLGFILLFERHQPGAAERHQPGKLLADVEPEEISAIEITIPGGQSRRAERLEGEWRLTQPPYPAQQTRVETLARTLAGLRKLDQLSPHDVLIQGGKPFGFDPPRAVLRVTAGTNEHLLQVGAATPLATNVYVRMEKTGEVFITDGSLLQALPGRLQEWRSTALVDLDKLRFDRVQIQAGNRLLELEKNATNGLWQITRPLPARADQNRVAALFQTLRGASASEFVADGAVSGLERYGLQTPDVEVALLQGTNAVFQLEFGSSPSDAPGQVYARRMDAGNVVKTDKALAEFFTQPYKSFHDQRLLTFSPGAVDRILVKSIENFTLQRQKDGSWLITEPERKQADRRLMQTFMTNLLGLEIVGFAKEVPTDADLKSLGVLDPVASYALSEQRTNAAGAMTNILFSEVAFGTYKSDTINAKRSDEAPVYIVPLPQVLVLPKHAFELRDRRLWDFTPSNLVSVTVSEGEAVRNHIPDPAYGWSQDPIQNAAMEELLFRIGRAEALGWVAQGEDKLATFGIKNDSPAGIFRVKVNDGQEERQIRFGSQFRGYVYATANLSGEKQPLVFLFPFSLYEEFMRQFAPPRP